MSTGEPPYRLVADAAGVAEVAARVAEVEEVGLDTEADNQHHYRTILCLLQIEVAGRVYLVDCLAGADVGPVIHALSGRRLVMHGSDFDLRILRERDGFRPAGLFDTMHAAQLLGRQRFGLASLLEDSFGLKLAKEHQKANWSARPISTRMLEYAALDASHLRPLRDLLAAELRAAGRLEWLEQRCRWQIEQAGAGFERDRTHAWRIAGAEKLTPRGRAALYELWHWRDREAERLDTPHFKVLTGDRLLQLAREVGDGRRDTMEKILATRGARRLRGLEEAVRAAAARDPASLPRRPRGEQFPSPSAEEQARHERIKAHRDALAAKFGLDPSLLANRLQLGHLAREPAAAEEVLLPWQVELLRPVLGGGG